jgi:hypothetical protein
MKIKLKVKNHKRGWNEFWGGGELITSSQWYPTLWEYLDQRGTKFSYGLDEYFSN